jgi:gas vesicle protein
MNRFGFLFATFVGAVVGGAAALTYKISRETGKTLSESAAEVPAEAMRYWEDIRARGLDAYEAGRSAARRKEEEIQKQFGGEA